MNRRARWNGCLLGGLLAVTLLAEKSLAGEPIQFTRDVRPIFARHCTVCHGGVKSAGGISFVSRQRAFTEGNSGEKAIVPGHPESSALIARVTSTDPKFVMPRPKHGPRLSEKDIATLKRWVQEGAAWEEHWSFLPPREPPEPEVADRAWPRIPADRFILARLEAEGLRPSPEASVAEWLRRVSLDLTGLPPSVEEFESYRLERAQDPTAAREQVVDRLLKSPRFGERWATMWLDLARYADTYGYEKDPHRDIWPWRDWVIRAFNADMPFDQFTIKQLAGDLLPEPTADDLLATAFHRNTQTNTEGGTNDEEFRTVAVLDRVNTTWTVWQATTFGCVQCHAHPYDPFAQRDYYRSVAFFDNTEDCDQNDDFPKLPVPPDAAPRAEAAKQALRLGRLRETLNRTGRDLAEQVHDWKPLVPTEARASGGSLQVGPDGLVTAGGTLPIGVTYTLRVPAVPGLTALRLRILPDDADPKKWPERGAVLSHLRVTLVQPGQQRRDVPLREVIADFLAGPFDPQQSLDTGAGGFGDFPSMNGPRWCVVLLENPLPADAAGGSLELVLVQAAASNSGFQACTLRRFRLSGSTDPRWVKLHTDADRGKQWDEVHALKASLGKLPGPRVPVMVERGDDAVRDTRVFLRGNRLRKGDSVRPGLPDILPPLVIKGRRATRLDLARWLVSDRNPLTARVLVNRLWAEMFGRGIVETLEDFGTSGARPTHPELLDHLALRLAGKHRWSVKAFLREIALSATYAQKNEVTPTRLQKDPQNRLWSRGPRVRLTAEMVRDQGLALSGLLSAKPFGPPVFPPQPYGVWRNVYSGATWTPSKGEDRYRRAIYTYCRRTSGYPGFLLFDAPTRDACTARRVPTNTPLQALVTLNDPAFLEMAQGMARRMQAGGGSVRDVITRGCKLLTLNTPSPRMVETLLRLYEDAVKEYRNDPAAAAKLAATPESAALVLVANTLLNLDRALTR